MDDLKGKCCVITGGAGILGSSMAEALASRGVRTVILDINSELAVTKATQIASSTSGEVMGVGADVLRKESLIEAKKAVNSAYGHIDFLVNAAGGNSPKGTTAAEFFTDDEIERIERTIFGLDLEGFRSVFELNFMGTLLPTMVFASDMIDRKKGAVVNISSMASFRPLTRVAAYSAAKASVNNFTAWLAVHLARMNVRVNAIAPGFFVTEQNRYLLYDKESGGLSDRGRKIIDSTPMKRFGTPEELHGALLFLLSEAARFITGIVLPVDGGFSAYAGV